MAPLVKCLVVVAVAMAVSCLCEGTQVHHVVGGDPGWDPSTDISSWAAGRNFMVGDMIWFAYSAAHGRIAELKTKEEYESCDVRNPIRMYTDGLDSIPLDGEGSRYFASTDPESCKNGLRLHVEVMPRQKTPKEVHSSEVSASVLADGPTPSCSTYVGPTFGLLLLMSGLFMYHFI